MPFQRTGVLGIVGDSATGKTTITQDVARILGGEDKVTMICTDDYHRLNRKRRKEQSISALEPACNYIDIMEQHLDLLRRGHPILKPVYNHSTGDFDPPVYVEPKEFIIAEGLLGFHSKALRRSIDVKVFLAPEEELRIHWKVKRDTAKRGYTPEEVKASLEKRTHHSRNHILPQQEYADIVVSFQRPPDQPEESGSGLNVKLKLRPGLPHPDLTDGLQYGPDGALDSTVGKEGGRLIEVLDLSGKIATQKAAQLESAIWGYLPDLEPIKPEGFGECLNGDQVRQSHTLALTQMMIAYHMLLVRQELKAELAEREQRFQLASVTPSSLSSGNPAAVAITAASSESEKRL